MTFNNIRREDKKEEAYPLWLAALKYDNSKSFRENYIDNALNLYAVDNTVYSLEQQQKRRLLETARELDRTRKRKKRSWRDYVETMI